MRSTALNVKLKAAVMAMTVTAVAWAGPSEAQAAVGSPIRCEPGAACKVGEFLFDDEYLPVTTGTCTLTSRYPDGSLFLNSQALTSTADAWYAHDFTAPSTEGYYRSQICCTVGSDYLCVDKSFEVKDEADSSGLTADSVATAVWGYGSRSLTGFGNLVSDISSNVWTGSGRSLTNWGTLIQDIWKHDPRTVTSGSGGSNLEAIEKTVNENRMLLEKLVNKPIIQNFVEEEEIDLSERLKTTRETAGEMYLNSQVVVSNWGVGVLAWEDLTGDEVAAKLAEVRAKLGQPTDAAGVGSVIGQADWLVETWGWEEARAVKDQALAVSSGLVKVERTLKGAGGWTAAYSQAREALASAEKLEQLLGTAQDEADQSTVFGRLAQIEALAKAWDSSQTKVDGLLGKIKPGQTVGLQREIDEVTAEVLADNLVPEGTRVIKPAVSAQVVEKRLKNNLLAVRGLIGMNRVFVAKGPAAALAYTWLEEGSIVFKSVITNPSKLIGQEVEVKYYLPPEVKEEDILETDEGLEVKYDSEKGQYYVEGKFLLKVAESKTVAVRVDDKWDITTEEVASLKKQAEELARPLEKTAFFAQSVTIKSDIDVALDKIVALMEGAVTPEQKIRAYREAEIEMGGVTVKMEKLKDLVAQSSVTGGLQGFMGGVQVIAVWGLVIILLAGFVFLALYMRVLSGRKTVRKSKSGDGERPQVHHPTNSGGSSWRMGFTVVLAAIVSSTASSAVVAKALMGRVDRPQAVVVSELAAETPQALVAGAATGGPEMVRINTSEGKRVSAHESAGAEGKIVFRVAPGEVEKLGESGSWVEILDSDGRSGWVSQEFISGQSPER